MEKTPHTHGPRGSRSKTVGGAQSCLKSNPRPPEGLGGQTELCVHQDPAKGAVTPQETEPGLPVSVQASPEEARVSSGPLRGRGGGRPAGGVGGSGPLGGRR